MTTVKKVKLAEHHRRLGRTKHTLSDSQGRRDFPPFTSLAIAREPESSGFYLLYFSDQGPGADTFHLSLDDALHQAEWEFGVMPAEWTEVNEPPGK